MGRQIPKQRNTAKHRPAPPDRATPHPSVSATTPMGKDPMNINAADKVQMLSSRPWISRGAVNCKTVVVVEI